MKRAAIVTGSALAILGLGTSAALASWAGSGSGRTGTKKFASLDAPGAPTVTNTLTATSGVSLSWTAATLAGSTSAAVQYYVQRTVATAAAPDWTLASSVCGTHASPISATSCSDSQASAGSYHYRAVSRVGKNWDTVGTHTNVTVPAAVTAEYNVALSSVSTGGSTWSGTVTAAVTSNNVPLSGYTVTGTWSTNRTYDALGTTTRCTTGVTGACAITAAPTGPAGTPVPTFTITVVSLAASPATTLPKAATSHSSVQLLKGAAASGTV